MQVPAGLIEAAKMDGAGHWKTLWKIIMPMTKSSFITFGLMSFITCYNNYMWPSLITDDTNLSLVSQGLRQFFIEGGAYGTNWSLVMAGSAVTVSYTHLDVYKRQDRIFPGCYSRSGGADI